MKPTLPRADRIGPTNLDRSDATHHPTQAEPRAAAPACAASNPLLSSLPARATRASHGAARSTAAEQTPEPDGAEAHAMAHFASLAIIDDVQPAPPAPEAADTSNATPNAGPSLDHMPVELIHNMDLDARQMQFASRRYAHLFHGEAVGQSLAEAPAKARSFAAIDAAVAQLRRLVPVRRQGGALAQLAARLERVPMRERQASFDTLLAAARQCPPHFELLTELFRQTNDWAPAQRDACQVRLADMEGADAARVAASANNILDVDDIPALLQRTDGMPEARRSDVLGALAKQLFGLHYLRAHDFARICERFHAEPWPPAAAAGLLRRIGWITDEARRDLTARSEAPG
ncbi:hypothetical protein [Burkholderia perseverans]|uniref:hypothetical protein n=1 Tax=Burkholderia perseverans TaxID=2615214 RepID=UPI001FEDE158|nr:hypothetical protein [Burkholderia perseverans]